MHHDLNGLGMAVEWLVKYERTDLNLQDSRICTFLIHGCITLVVNIRKILRTLESALIWVRSI